MKGAQWLLKKLQIPKNKINNFTKKMLTVYCRNHRSHYFVHEYPEFSREISQNSHWNCVQQYQNEHHKFSDNFRLFERIIRVFPQGNWFKRKVISLNECNLVLLTSFDFFSEGQKKKKKGGSWNPSKVQNFNKCFTLNCER